MTTALIDEVLEALDRWPEKRVSFFVGSKPGSKTFGELAQDVRTLAEHLRAAHVTAGMRVGILAPNSYAWVVHDLALQQLRAIPVAFPDKLPCAVAELQGRYRLNLLFVSEGYAAEVEGLSAVVPIEKTLAQQITPTSDFYAPPADQTGDQEVISITFSSGSSGKLKTLKVTSSGTKQTITGFCSLFEFLPEDHFLIFLPLSSYQQRIMIYGCILYGAEFSVIDATQLFKAFMLLRPTLLLAPPILFENIHENFERGLRQTPLGKRLAFHALRIIQGLLPKSALRAHLARTTHAKAHEIFGGRIRIFWTGMAPIRPSTLRFFSRAGFVLYEAYGLNECGPIASNSAAAHRLGSVGRPIVPDSVVLAPDGEVLIKNPFPIAIGYEDCDPGEAEAVFRPDGLIGTGDLGYFDADGFLYLKGRKKEIIITREGFKISPELLERKINEHPAALQSVVFGNNMDALAAVIVVETLDEENRKEIEAHVRRINEGEQPCFAIEKVHLTTTRFAVDNGQLTRNLKLDRRAIFAAHRNWIEPKSA